MNLFRIFAFRKRKYSITLMTQEWKPFLEWHQKLETLPRRDELIYVEEINKYFVVLNIIHYLNAKHGIFVVVEETKSNTPITSLENK